MNTTLFNLAKVLLTRPKALLQPSKLGGFSLIELMVTLAIIALLASAVLPLSQLAIQRSQEAELKTALRTLRNAIDAYKKAGDEGRIEKAFDASGYPPSLEILAEGVLDLKDLNNKRKLKFLRAIPRDPMQADTTLSNAQTWGKRSYDSDWNAPQSGEDIYDVYSMSPKKAINGLFYRDW